MDSPEKALAAKGLVVPSRADGLGRVLARLVWAVVHLMGSSLRWRWVEPAGQMPFDRGQRVIFCIWHNRLALAMLLYHRRIGSRYPGRKMAGLVSASRDGGLLARGLELFHVVPIRGSSSRRGAQAIRELVTAAEAGCDLAITPDGPRGPCYSIHPGVIAMAQMTGLPVVPVSYHLSWKYRLKSWDRFQIPIPFASVEVFLGEPLEIPRELNSEAREAVRIELVRRMMSITRD
jgi:lysophospholipid acyltransferase (LPLAT)-like uncharacterized protein